MTTVTNPVLPIPEDTIQGTGSYTVPANKYGFLSANTSFAASGWMGDDTNDYQDPASPGWAMAAADTHLISSSASANSTECWLSEGDTLSVGNLSTTGQVNNNTNSYTGFFTEGYTSVRLNSVDICVSRASGGYTNPGGNGNMCFGVRATGRSGWSVALYPIPKNNLPLNLIEGN